MATTMDVVYQSALLADAAYVSLEVQGFVSGGLITDAAWSDVGGSNSETFQSRGFTRNQFEEFQRTYRILHHQPDTLSGFSATLFENRQTGELHLSFRGTNDAADFIQDATLLNPLLDGLRMQLQNGAAENFLKQAGLLDEYGSIRQEYAGRINLSGHSLGGHLALWTAARHAGLVARVDTFNGAGLGYGSPMAVALQSFWNDTVAASFRGSSIDPARLHNFYAEAGPELVATGTYAYRPGAHVPLFIENPGNAIDTHQMRHLVTSLAAYRVFAALDGTLDAARIGELLGAAANSGPGSIAAALGALGRSLGGAYAGMQDAQAMHARLVADVDAGAFAGARVEVASGRDIASAVLESSQAGNAWRFAVVNLLPFAVVGPELPAQAYTLERFTPEYLQARAYLLQSLLLRNALDASTVAELGRGPEFFEDMASGVSFTSSQAAAPFPLADAVHYRFGSAGADELNGGNRADRLFAMDGDDWLRGLAGDDWLEGGEGNDTLLGGDGDDVLHGGAGADRLVAGAGNDTLWGGAGADTYVFGNNDGVNLIADADDGADRILINAFSLANLHWEELEPGSDIFRDSAGWGLQITRQGESLYIRSGGGPDAGMIIVSQYADAAGGNFGIVLSPAEPVQPPVVQEPETVLALQGDRAPLDGDPDTEGLQLQYDALGNLRVLADEWQLRDDTLFGSAGNDLIDAGDGDNLVRARGGDDRIVAGQGKDSLFGEAGDDHLLGGGGDDSVGGGAGKDWLEGGAGSDILDGGEGDDVLHAGLATQFAQLLDGSLPVSSDRDWLSGGAGDDTLIGGSGVDVLMGGGGKDLLRGGSGDDHLMGDGALLASSFGWTVTDDLVALLHLFSPVSGEIDPADAGDDTLLGGAGNDWIDAGRGNDFASGDAGNDSMGGHAGDDTLNGGAGDDLLEGDAPEVHLAGAQHGHDLLIGGEGNDSLGGSGGNDTLLGGEGDDLLYGDANTLSLSAHGADRLLGDAGNDSLFGGAGDDLLDGGAGADQLSGDAGSDTLRGGDGDDTLRGDGPAPSADDDGDDLISGGAGRDYLDGGGGKDTLDGGEDNDTLWGGAGDDRLLGGAGHDMLEGGADADLLSGDAGNDTLQGGDGPDDLRGGMDADMLFGGADNDLLRGGDGADSLVGGSGDDQLLGQAGDDQIWGEDGNDLLQGGAGADTLDGGAGNDTLDGGAGDDVLIGGDGDDTYVLRAGGGQDSIVDSGGRNTLLVAGAASASLLGMQYSAASAAVTLRFGGASLSMSALDYKQLADISVAGTSVSGAELLRPTAGADLLVLPGTDDVLHALGGNDTVYGGDGRDELHGGDDSDHLHGEQGDDRLFGGSGGDQLFGGTGNDTLDGGLSPDVLWGEDGHDLLQGGDGTDTLWGGSGDDTLDGGAGNDSLNGGAGADTVLFGPGSGVDRFAVVGLDRDIVRFAAGVDAAALALRNYGSNDLHLITPDGDTLILQGWFAFLPGTPALELHFDDGTVWSGAQMLERFQSRVATEGPDVLEGLGGNDTLEGLGGDDALWGAAGNDLLSGGDGADTLQGGTGADTLLGGNGDDRLLGGEGNDIQLGEAGNDTLEGGAGNDSLAGGSGNDRLDAGDGADTLQGGTGDDELRGGRGGDVYLYAPGDGRDRIVENDPLTVGAEGFDVLQFNGGIGPGDVEIALVLRDPLGFLGYNRFFDTNIGIALRLPGLGGEVLIANADDTSLARSRIDEIRFSDAQQSVLTFSQIWSGIISADAGHDFLEGSSVADTLDGLAGDDILYGADGYDLLRGGAGHDTLLGGTGADTLDGGPGNDFLRGGDDVNPNTGLVDRYIWGRGYDHDTVWARPDSQFWLSGSNNAPYPADELQLSGVGWQELWAERDGNDLHLIVPGAPDRLTVLGYFQSGHQQLRIRKDNGGHYLLADVEQKILATEIQRQISSGDDVIIGSEQLGDVIDALDGDDRVEGRGGNDLLQGGAGNDLLLGDSGNDTLHGGVGHDTLDGGEGVDHLAGGDGDDQLQGAAGNDVLQGGVGNDTLDGGEDNDQLAGGDGDDRLDGAGGHDTLQGDAGNDTLAGGAGDDQLAGGSGNDSYVFGFGDGSDRIFDADKGTGRVDGIEMRAGVRPDDVRIGRSGDDLVLTLADSGESITVARHFLVKGKDIGYHIDEVRFEDGTLWTRATINDYQSRASSGNYLLTGGAGADVLQGLGGNDTLGGAGGDDVLHGGAGNDLLQGGPGADTLFGGKGADIYRFEAGHGADLIIDNDVSAQRDVLEFGAGIAPAQVLATRIGSADLLLRAGPDSVRVQEFFLAGEAAGAGIEEVRFADGTVWDRAQLLQAQWPGANQAPQAGADALQALENRELLLGAATLLANDWDPDGDELRISAVASGFGGVVLWDSASAQLRFQPDASYVGPAWFEYTLSDGEFAVSARVEVDVAIDTSGNARLGTAGNDALGGTRGDDRLYGLAGNDSVRGDRGNDQLSGGKGDDWLDGGWGNDTYVFHRDDGRDVIDNRSSRSSDVDVLRFTSGIGREELWFLREGNDLVIGLVGSEGRVMVDEWYASDSAMLEQIQVPGAVLHAAQVDMLVQAMAAFDAPLGSGMMLDEAARNQLEPVLAAAWQV
jgi:Ca2+-binding RTX toxin-like protein